MSKEEEIAELKRELAHEEERISDKSHHGNYALRLKAKIELMELGCKVEDTAQGILVNDKFIVGVASKKWCVDGKYKWYHYKDIETFVTKYVRKP
jgi:hypothetical protein